MHHPYPSRSLLASFLTTLGLSLGLAVSGAHAADLAKPTGRVLLVVTGKIQNTNAPGRAEFDQAMLAALAQGAIKTGTPWHEGVQTFTGPLGSALAEAVGMTGETLQVTALNDYAAPVPVEDLRKLGVVLATHRNGEVMTVRDKGPLFIIYPFDVRPELKSEVYYNRSVWQIKSIDVR